jgi:hypothetical protein
MSNDAYFYSLAHIRGSSIMKALFEVDDPYSLAPAEIVERLLALGHMPVVVRMQREPLAQYGTTTEVQRDGHTYLVAVSRDAQLIAVQEVRTEPYPSE